MINKKLNKSMSIKNKLNAALNTLKKSLDDEYLQGAFAKIEESINSLPDESASAGNNLPTPLLNPDEIAMYSDGACRGNPGPGSWAFIAQDHTGSLVQTASGVSEHTTNNKMELQGVIEGLNYLKGESTSYRKIFYFTDSKYVVDGITSWVKGWKKRGWKKADKKAPENLEQWQELDMLNERFNVEFIWVKGHAGHPQNELCDQLANEALDAQGF
ncbi:MAG: ribonuclease HI [Bacteriovoracaceae bacterium]|nr:ribonuclease HI [Bacteriovoracaceae bacterium]